MFREFGRGDTVEMQVQDSDLVLRILLYRNRLTEFIFVNDIDKARKIFIGTTLWLNKTSINTYDDSTGKTGEIKNKKLAPVKITNVVASTDSNKPIRFVLELPTGEQGYLDVALSQTNVDLSVALDHTFHNYFESTDPETIYRFPPEIWAAIKDEKVLIGMTPAQVRLAWGSPDTVSNNQTSTDIVTFWSYANGRHVLFSGGKVSVIGKD